MLASLQLRTWWIELLELKPSRRSSRRRKGEPAQFSMGIKHSISEDTKKPLEFACRLELRFFPTGKETAQSTGPRFDVKLILVGEFEIHQSAEARIIPIFKHANAPAILYGLARGIVGQITSLTAQGQLIIPSVNFTAGLREKTRGKVAALDTPSKRAKKTKSPSRGVKKRTATKTK